MKREKQFCAVWMEKKHEWSLEEKKSLQRYIQERKKLRKKLIIVRYLWKTNKNLCRPVV